MQLELWALISPTTGTFGVCLIKKGPANFGVSKILQLWSFIWWSFITWFLTHLFLPAGTYIYIFFSLSLFGKNDIEKLDISTISIKEWNQQKSCQPKLPEYPQEMSEQKPSSPYRKGFHVPLPTNSIHVLVSTTVLPNRANCPLWFVLVASEGFILAKYKHH